MSIHFGHYSLDTRSQQVVTTYNSFYPAISKNWRYPVTLNTAYPVGIFYVKGIDEYSQIKLLLHTFDNDDTITSLELRYTLCAAMSDKTEIAVDLKDINMTSKKFTTTDNSLFNRQYFIINEPFTISEYIADYKDIELMYIRFKQLSNESYGNESNLSLVVIHHL